MGIYLNPDNTDFQESLNSEIYVDKSELINLTNSVVRTQQKYVCVSRPRRFGKSVTANMLTAYYSRGCDSKEMFSSLKIAGGSSFEKHMNSYNVIHINIVELFRAEKSMTDNIDYMSKRLLHELRKENSDIDCFDWNDIIAVLNDIYSETKIPFIFIIDEWDCIFRIKKYNSDDQTEYLNFLRNLLKDKSYVALAYMTGILPIKKYEEHSALNMFSEISVIDAGRYAEFTGFTDEEVSALCEEYSASFDDIKRWYNGYYVEGIPIYNPRSIVESIRNSKISNYWTKTETYEALKVFIQANFDGLHDKVTQMIAGNKVEINTAKFQNDMTSFVSADDILTLLVHLGYLTFEELGKEALGRGMVWIPNAEVQQEFINCIEDKGWEPVMKAIRASDELIQNILDGDTDNVAKGVEICHEDNTSILQYNDENSLSCVISLAFYSARKYYKIIRELPTGKGFADLVLLPYSNCDKPAMVIELKHEKSADTAIKQIKEKRYTGVLEGYADEIILVGISYDENKNHSCVIERYKHSSI
ncbi:MAG: ATP-binding protein [Lachnospiraceae bacterium]|nr:ATP-binding protein [Lachnospiraceae bacterium]